jgi:hypothetical protein
MHGPSDRLGAAMLVGALVGFVIGAVVGLSSPDFSGPVVGPLVGAIAGLALAWVPFAYFEASRRRRALRERELEHDRMRVEAHRGWVEGVDIGGVTPRRAGGASAHRTRPG